ncbi:MAG: hypothetical protein HQ559_13690 [Lentisphaerae bacterium]|nr:hypothetical protein [Lentisphaerota bacterium]
MMKNRITTAIQKLDAIPEQVPLIVNLCIAGFVGLAHGGALAIALTKEQDQLASVKPLASISLPLAGLIIITSIVALLARRSRRAILGTHAVILTLGAAAMLAWAASILIDGIPKVSSFSWSPGMMTFLCVYPVYLLRRTVLAGQLSRPMVKYLHVGVLLVALFVDVGVFVKLMSRFSSFGDGPQRPPLTSVDHPIVGKWKMVDNPEGDVHGLAFLVVKATGEFEVYRGNVLNSREPFQIKDDIFISEEDFDDLNRRPRIVIEGDKMKLIIESSDLEQAPTVYEYKKVQ